MWLKLETLQYPRTFKWRGACNAALAMAERGPGLPHLVTASAGNHGVALSRVAQELGATLTIHVPRGAPRAKLDRLRGPGVTIVAECATYDEAEAHAIGAASAGDGVFISAYNHPDVIAGAGTVALEVLDELPNAGAIVVPTGGGGLLAGVAAGADGRVPVVGAEAAANPAFTEALRHGRITSITPGLSLADGLLGNLERDAVTFGIVKSRHIPVHTVPEPLVAAGMRALFAEERLVAEGAGAVAIGSLLHGALASVRDPLVLLVTGANVDADVLAAVLAGADGPAT